MSSSRIRLLTALAALAACGSVMAQSKTWTFNDTSTSPTSATCSGPTGGSSNGLGNAYACAQQPSGSAKNLTVTAWSATSSSNYAAAAVTPQGGNGYGAGNSSENGIYANSSNGDHSVDNGNSGGVDALLLKFTSGAEALTHVTTGWSGSDGDYQILRWTGAAPPSDSSLLTGKNTSNLVAAGGWELVATINQSGGIDATDSTITGFNNNLLSSSYWLLSAYSSNITGAKGTYGTSTASSGIDQLKFLGVGSTTPTPPPGVPEPVSLALVSVALAGVGVSRRRRAAAA